MDIKQTLSAVPKEATVSILGNLCWGSLVAGWAVMDDISWPVAIVLGLAAVYLVIALVNVYKKSEWPFVPSLEQTVKNAIEHAGYQNKRMPHLPEYVFNYQIEIDGLQANIYQTQAIDSM